MINHSKSDDQEGEVLDSIYWDADSPEKFLGFLRAHEQEISETLEASSETNVLEKFQTLMESVIKEGKFKKGTKKSSGDAPWFDIDCRKGKDAVTEAGKNVQRNPKDLNLRKVLGEKKKIFRSLIRDKKGYMPKIFSKICLNMIA